MTIGLIFKNFTINISTYCLVSVCY